jgi:predicted ester cyclase
MSADENRAVVRRYHAEVRQGNLDVVEEVFAPTFLRNGQPETPAALRRRLAALQEGLPDIGWRDEEQLAEGDTVVTRWSIRGTHRGELLGVAPTGRPVTSWGISIHRLAGGRIVEEWVAGATLDLLRQLGGAPPPASAAGPAPAPTADRDEGRGPARA